MLPTHRFHLVPWLCAALTVSAAAAPTVRNLGAQPPVTSRAARPSVLSTRVDLAQPTLRTCRPTAVKRSALRRNPPLPLAPVSFACGFAAVGAAVLGLWRLIRGTTGPSQWSMGAQSAEREGRKVFCDLDGVLSDFEAYVRRIFGRAPDAIPPPQLWRTLASINKGRPDGFYDQLPWMPEGKELFEALRPHKPTILTGLPIGKWAAPQKRRWCARELGPDVPVITCMAREKHRYCVPGAILIDDSLKLRDKWLTQGGIFIHHTSNSSTLEQLRRTLTQPVVANSIDLDTRTTGDTVVGP